MKSTFKLIILFIMILMSATFCDKKLFTHIKVTGRVLNYFTGQPLSAAVGLMSVSKFSGSSFEDVSIGTAHTDGNGYFTIGGRASKANDYFLFIDQDLAQNRPVQVKESGTTDLGNFLSGQKMYFLKVILIADSSTNGCVQMGGTTYPAGTYTSVVSSIRASWQDSIPRFLNVFYNITNCSYAYYQGTAHTRLAPVNGDTATQTIHY